MAASAIGSKSPITTARNCSVDDCRLSTFKSLFIKKGTRIDEPCQFAAVPLSRVAMSSTTLTEEYPSEKDRRLSVRVSVPRLGKSKVIIMLRKLLILTPLLFIHTISHGVSDVDIFACEAQASDDQRIKCYRDLMLNPSCHVVKKKDQLLCFRRSAVRTVSRAKDNALRRGDEPTDRSNDFFGQPQRLCSALSHIGLDTSGWKQKTSSPETEWRCFSGDASFGSFGPISLKNEIAYHIYGTTPNRVNDIRIIININNPSERKQALERLEAATRTLFKEISEHLPLDLILALRHKTPLSLFTDFGTVNLIRTAGPKESYKIVLTDTKIIPDNQQLQSRVTDDFLSCKKVTAKAVGYSVSEISGTGVPLQGSGFKSYRLSGRGMDWFICKVYPGGKYRIEAAMDRKYPNGYIEEGSF